MNKQAVELHFEDTLNQNTIDILSLSHLEVGNNAKITCN